jgi:hypothetical protein
LFLIEIILREKSDFGKMDGQLTLRRIWLFFIARSEATFPFCHCEERKRRSNLIRLPRPPYGGLAMTEVWIPRQPNFLSSFFPLIKTFTYSSPNIILYYRYEFVSVSGSLIFKILSLPINNRLSYAEESICGNYIATAGGR